MPPRKHQRAASDPSSNAGPSAKASKIVKVERSDACPRATFQDLPFELRKTILDLACSRNTAIDVKQRLSLDSNMLFNLILVSREFYTTLKPTLWRHVKLVRPSALAEFRESLVRRPANGELVRSLHIGPLSDLPRGWWPLRAKEPDQDWTTEGSLLLLRTGLTHRDGATRPVWCKPNKEWAYDLTARTCQGGAVNNAIRQALFGVDISLCDPANETYQFCDWRGQEVGINEWTLRLFEVQGALDLYLGEMRRIEQASNRAVRSWKARKTHPVGKDPRECCRGECAHYPHLVLKGFEGRRSKESDTLPRGDTFLVTRDDIKKHLARRGSLTDNFEHPVVFAQTSLRVLAASHGGAVEVDYDERRADSFYGEIDTDEEYDLDDMLPRYNDDDFSQPTDAALRPPSPTDSEGSAHDTFDLLHHDGISALANSVLRRTPNVLNLSLTGYLFRGLHPPKPPLLVTLRCLSLGPPATPPAAQICLSDLSLPALEKLRFCGTWLGSRLARLISGQTGDWKHLRETQWDYGSHKIGRDAIEHWMVGTAHVLQGRSEIASPSPVVEGQPREPLDDGELTQDEERLLSSAITTPTTRYTEARIHPTLLFKAIEEAPSATVCRAWQHGLPVDDAPHRVRLVESRAANMQEDENHFIPRPRQDYEILRSDSEKWWEECAWELEHESRSSSK